RVERAPGDVIGGTECIHRKAGVVAADVFGIFGDYGGRPFAGGIDGDVDRGRCGAAVTIADGVGERVRGGRRGWRGGSVGVGNRVARVRSVDGYAAVSAVDRSSDRECVAVGVEVIVDRMDNDWCGIDGDRIVIC